MQTEEIASNLFVSFGLAMMGFLYLLQNYSGRLGMPTSRIKSKSFEGCCYRCCCRCCCHCYSCCWMLSLLLTTLLQNHQGRVRVICNQSPLEAGGSLRAWVRKGHVMGALTSHNITIVIMMTIGKDKLRKAHPGKRCSSNGILPNSVPHTP